MANYKVVFQYTSAAKGYEGNRYQIPFNSKQEFDSWYTEEVKKKQTVVAEGVTDEEALRLCMDVPLSKRFNAATEGAKNDTGRLNPAILEMNIRNIAILEGLRINEGLEAL